VPEAEKMKTDYPGGYCHVQILHSGEVLKLTIRPRISRIALDLLWLWLVPTLFIFWIFELGDLSSTLHCQRSQNSCQLSSTLLWGQTQQSFAQNQIQAFEISELKSNQSPHTCLFSSIWLKLPDQDLRLGDAGSCQRNLSKQHELQVYLDSEANELRLTFSGSPQKHSISFGVLLLLLLLWLGLKPALNWNTVIFSGPQQICSIHKPYTKKHWPLHTVRISSAFGDGRSQNKLLLRLHAQNQSCLLSEHLTTEQASELHTVIQQYLLNRSQRPVR